MSDHLHVLLIDDNPDDRALVMRELRREFPKLHIEEVTESRGFQTALEEGDSNLVITDYQLRWTDGISVLRAIKAKWPECPVIMFTGTGSEEVAVEAMKAGLDDYVLKSPKHYARLPASAHLALKVARQRQELKEAERRYSSLFNSVPVALYRATTSGRILDANPAMIKMLGYPDAATLLQTDFRLLHARPDEYEKWKAALESIGLVQNYETQLRAYNGSLRWVENTAKAVRDENDDELVCEGSLEDITERKNAEQEREKLIVELQEALAKVKTLSGLLPICAACKKIRDDQGYWNQIEVYIQTHSEAEFTHSFCPDCMRRLYPEVFEKP